MRMFIKRGPMTCRPRVPVITRASLLGDRLYKSSTVIIVAGNERMDLS